MPELPEVETVRRIVERDLTDRSLECVDLRLPKLLRDSPLATLDLLVGRRVLGARRRAKVLIVDWSDDFSLLIHFKLAGQFAVIHADGTRHVAGHPVPDPAGPYPHKVTHVTLEFGGGVVAHFSDVRQFGWLRLMPSADVAAAIAVFRFGPEAAGAEPLDPLDLAARLGRRSIAIKLALLDQTVLAGLGNIYVDEALHRARIHPTRPANALTGDELARLREAIPWALDRGLEQGGATIVNNRAHPRDGFPQVHALAGEPCPTCASPVEKIRVGARGTYLCSRCQPAR